MTLTKPSRKLRVLLADDDADDRSFFSKALIGIPIATELTMVRDGEELMDYLSDHVSNFPDILFLDLSMPRKTGFECLIEIKENELFKDLSIAVFTTSFGHSIHFENNLAQTLSNFGSLQYIRKPNSIEELKQIIYEILIKIIDMKFLTKEESDSNMIDPNTAKNSQ
jgi:CheY-like chemotaxis protein